LGSIEEKLDTAEFMRCHKSYIINLSMITQLEVYGRWTYTVKLKGTDATALMTSQKYEEIKQLYE
jgi:two-component system LytT family response regulator